jgi:predicted phage-related endonuclease
VRRPTRVFRPAVERQIEARFGIVRPVTDAVRLLRAGQENTPAWLDARSATVGASEISVLMMTDHPYHSRYSLWHVKAHGWGRFTQTDAQERGHLLEPGIARRFAAAHPELIVARPNGALWRDPQFPVLSCTPDYLTINTDGLIAPLECKSDEGGDWGPGDDDIPAHHRWQVWQQAGVFAAPYTYVARWSGRGYRDYLIGYDHDRYVRAAAQADTFMATVRAGTPPVPDGHRTTGDVIDDAHPYPLSPLRPVEVPAGWGEELEALRVTRREIDKQIKAYEHRVHAALGDAAAGWDTAGRSYGRKQVRRKGFTVAPSVYYQIKTSGPADRPDPEED